MGLPHLRYGLQGAPAESRQWRIHKDEMQLLAQMFKMTAGLAVRQSDKFSFSLISKWP